MNIFGNASVRELPEINLSKMKEIICAYKEASIAVTTSEMMNGVTFYDDGFALTDKIKKQLENLSLLADVDTYSVYEDDGKLVIY